LLDAFEVFAAYELTLTVEFEENYVKLGASLTIDARAGSAAAAFLESLPFFVSFFLAGGAGGIRSTGVSSSSSSSSSAT
jgi:hypothetical protein